MHEAPRKPDWTTRCASSQTAHDDHTQRGSPREPAFERRTERDDHRPSRSFNLKLYAFLLCVPFLIIYLWADR